MLTPERNSSRTLSGVVGSGGTFALVRISTVDVLADFRFGATVGGTLRAGAMGELLRAVFVGCVLCSWDVSFMLDGFIFLLRLRCAQCALYHQVFA